MAIPKKNATKTAKTVIPSKVLPQELPKTAALPPIIPQPLPRPKIRISGTPANLSIPALPIAIPVKTTTKKKK